MTRSRPGAVGPRAAAVFFLVVYRYEIIDYRYGNVKKVLKHLRFSKKFVLLHRI